MIVLQLGNSPMTTRIWILTPRAITCLFPSALPCEGCKEHHVMVAHAVRK
ncbi:hypothetical protein SEA_ARCHIMEDES_46 [Gordonia phage Archimedes]|uniref:Uncharacterized protein n=1 Tax=Gordonia phage Archimedes TaxID=2759389 RepID=A0A7L7SHM7_9CAUD|nr:hypothetical protein KCH38_gp46 [Gordonia phage Archimedes]QOC55746.1 hypothetical protein SEA_ARCHIMEDES_46 [Gordonia phage Archimedes]